MLSVSQFFSYVRTCLLALLLTSISYNTYAVYFEYTPILVESQKHMAALRLKQANVLIASEISKHPDNIAAHYLLHYSEFFRIMVQQDAQLQESFARVNENALARVATMADTDPRKRFLSASIHLQHAFVKGAFNNYLGAAWDFRTAYQLVEQNEKKFPSYLAHKKELGAITALIGTFPSQYMWIVNAVGLKGDFNKGLAIIKDYIQKSGNEPLIEKQQAIIIYTLIQLNFGSDKKATWNFTKEHTKEYASNLMLCYVRSYVAGKCGENAIALQTLKQRPIDDSYETIHYLNFLMGTYLVHELDFSAAIWFKRYLSVSKTKSAQKDAYQKLSWISWLQNDTAKFKIYHDLMLKSSKSIGSENTLTNRDLDMGIYPSRELLKARLLFDGGYFQQALQRLNGLSKSALPSKFQELEYEYRYGRIYQEMNKPALALEHYKTCIGFANMNSYLIPNACLNLGLVYEQIHYPNLAITYYEQVLNYRDFDHENSIHQKAKASLDRLK
jgi:hypothetical protein